MQFKNKVQAVTSILNYKLFNKRTPLAVCWIITNKCNFKCSYCEVWDRKKKELNTNQIFSIIDKLKKKKVQRISIFGGEPLLLKDIGKIIEYIKSKDIFVGLGTNGYLLKERINEVKNVDTLHVSFDGSEEIHNKQISNGTYSRVLNGIKVAREKKIKVWATTVLTKNNINELNFILEKAKEIDFTTYFQPVVNRALSGNVDFLFPNIIDYRKAISNLIYYKNNGYKKTITNSLTNLKILKGWPNHNINIKCYSRYLRMFIDSNGDVYPCGFLIGKYNAKNIIKDGFDAAFKNILHMNCGDDLKKCGCWDYAILEFSKLFALNPEVIINSIKLLNNYS